MSFDVQGKKPTFLIIGAMKAGTSSLWYYLRAHPEIYLPDFKEPDYFVKEKNLHLGWSWYQSLFLADINTQKAYGEASTSYSKHPMFSGVPERIAASLPHIRLIYLVRDPIARIKSMYVHMVSDKREKRSFYQAMSNLENNMYIELSMYYYQISQYLPFFSPDQILIITTEDLKNQRRNTLAKVFHFIGVAETFQSPQFDQELNITKNRRKYTQLGEILQSFGLFDRLDGQIPGGLHRFYKIFTSQKVKKPQISPNLRDNLLKVLKPDIDQLRGFTLCEFNDWDL